MFRTPALQKCCCLLGTHHWFLKYIIVIDVIENMYGFDKCFLDKNELIGLATAHSVHEWLEILIFDKGLPPWSKS